MTDPIKEFLTKFEIIYPARDGDPLNLSDPVSVAVQPYGAVVAMYYWIDTDGQQWVPGFVPDPGAPNDTPVIVTFNLTEQDCPTVGAHYHLTVTAWNLLLNIDTTGRDFYRTALTPPSGAYRKEVEAGKNLKPAPNAVLNSENLPAVKKTDTFSVVEIAGNPPASTKFYGHWFRRDGTGAIVQHGAWYRKNPKTGQDDPPHLMALSGKIPVPVDQAGTYTVVVLAGTLVDAPDQPHKVRIARAMHSVSFTYDGKS
jgi:hypothetical protein